MATAFFENLRAFAGGLEETAAQLREDVAKAPVRDELREARVLQDVTERIAAAEQAVENAALALAAGAKSGLPAGIADCRRRFAAVEGSVDELEEHLGQFGYAPLAASPDAAASGVDVSAAESPAAPAEGAKAASPLLCTPMRDTPTEEFATPEEEEFASPEVVSRATVEPKTPCLEDFGDVSSTTAGILHRVKTPRRVVSAVPDVSAPAAQATAFSPTAFSPTAFSPTAFEPVATILPSFAAAASPSPGPQEPEPETPPPAAAESDAALTPSISPPATTAFAVAANEPETPAPPTAPQEPDAEPETPAPAPEAAVVVDEPETPAPAAAAADSDAALTPTISPPATTAFAVAAEPVAAEPETPAPAAAAADSDAALTPSISPPATTAFASAADILSPAATAALSGQPAPPPAPAAAAGAFVEGAVAKVSDADLESAPAFLRMQLTLELVNAGVSLANEAFAGSSGASGSSEVEASALEAALQPRNKVKALVLLLIHLKRIRIAKRAGDRAKLYVAV